MDSGYVLLWRKAKDSCVFMCGDGIWRVFCYCLMEATHKPLKYIAHGEELTLKPGQFVTGRHKLARELGCAPSTAWTRLRRLVNLGIIDIKSDTNFSIVTVRKWESYQQGRKRCPTQLFDTSFDTTSDTTLDTTSDTTSDTKQTHKHITTKPTTTPAPSGAALNGGMVWGRWVDVNRAAGNPDPVPDGPDIKAAKRLAKLLKPDEVVPMLEAYLADKDHFVVKLGHPLRHMSGRINAYRNGSAGEPVQQMSELALQVARETAAKIASGVIPAEHKWQRDLRERNEAAKKEAGK